MKIQAVIRWSTWGVHEHGHGSRSVFVDQIPEKIDVIDGKLFPIYDDVELADDPLLKLIRSVEERREFVKQNGMPGFGEVWFNQEIFEIYFRFCYEKDEQRIPMKRRAFWGSEGWKEHKFD